MFLIILTVQSPISNAADSNFYYHYYFYYYFSEKTKSWQMIHMKCEDLFSMKKKKKK